MRVFLITGCSTGFGEAYVRAILDNGDAVVATARKPEVLQFQGTNDKNFLAVQLDVTDKASIDEAFSKAVEKFGRVDVVCNNAGYGLGGPFETLTEAQTRTQFDVNFFGLLAVTHKALETMRANEPKGGIIQQITSIGGQIGVPAFSVYCASKWAVEGFTEALVQEVKPEWNIKFQLIEPGGFTTEWAGSSMKFGEAKTNAYDIEETKQSMEKRNGTQGGDPVKAGLAMYQLAVIENPPALKRQVLGSDALDRITKKIETYSKDINSSEYADLAKGCDHNK